MSIVVLDLIQQTLRQVNVLAAGETASPEDSAAALLALNQLLASWSTDRAYVYSTQYQAFPVAAGKGAYTIGPGGDFDTARPVHLKPAQFINAGGEEFPLELYAEEKWATVKDKAASSRVVLGLYWDSAYPKAGVHLWPVPTQAGCQVGLYTWQPITGANPLLLADTIDLPFGYERALRAALAVEIAPEFGRTVSQELAAIAGDAKRAIQQLNLPPTPGAALDAGADAQAQQIAAPPQQ